MFALAAVKCVEMCKAILVVGGVFGPKTCIFVMFHFLCRLGAFLIYEIRT